MNSPMTKMAEAEPTGFNDRFIDRPAVYNRWVYNGEKAMTPAKSLNINDLISSRAKAWSVDGQNQEVMKKQSVVWDFLLDHYFRLEMTGWDRLPATASMLVGIHSGTWLTMDAWTLCAQWWRRYSG